MARAKVSRKSTAIDMTAMCDVAFLLLTFFILSAKPRTESPVKADTPSSSATFTIPETDYAVITIGEDKVFYTIEGDNLRMETIKLMSDTWKVPFTTQQIKEFSTTEAFGLPLNQLGQFLDLPSAERSRFKAPGMQVDTNKVNDLSKWVEATRKANVAIDNVDTHIAIRADKQEDYPVVERVIKSLGKSGVNKFSLITSSLATAPKK